MSRSLWIALAIVSLGLLALTLERVGERGRFATAYSSYGSGPRGTRGLFLLVNELRAPPQRWAQDLARLPERGVLVALGGCDADMARALSRYERQELVRWVRAGGVLMLAGARAYLPQAFGVRFASEVGCASPSGADAEPLDDAHAHPPAQAQVPNDAGTAAADAGNEPEITRAPDAPLPPGETNWAIPMAQAVRGLPLIPFRESGELVIDPDFEPEILLGEPRRDSTGAESDVVPLAVVLRHGLGRVIVLASASMLQNRELASSDGGALFMRLLSVYAPNAPVLFDEYHLGIGERRSLMRYLRQMGAAPLVLQLLVLAAVFFWRGGARFGGLQLPAARPAPDGSSYVIALGRLYERAADSTGALELIARDAWQRIAAHHHLEPGAAATAARLAAALRQRGATAAALGVEQIELAAKSGKERPRLPEAVDQIDRALASALE